MTEEQRDDFGEGRPASSGRSFTQEEIVELLPGFALGALEPEEMLAVESYLQSHPEWQERLQVFEDVAASLAHAAPRAALPARAKERLMGRVYAEAPATQTRKHPLAATVVPTPRPQMRGLRSIPRRPKPSEAAPGPNWFGVLWRSMAVAGATAAIVLLAALTWQLRGRVAELSSQLALVQGQMTQLQEENTRLQQLNTSLQEQLQRQEGQLALFTHADQIITLTGTEAAPTARGKFARQADAGILVLDGLPPLPSDQVYQLWIIPPDGPSLPADLIQIASPETATVEVAIAPEHSNLIGVGISVEPAGGSQTPTTIVLLGTLNPAST